MKKILNIFLLFFFLSSLCLITPQNTSAQSVSFQAFYDDLSPHGSWFESADYGYVWRPRLTGFTPYSTNGYWVSTEAGWTWVSDYSWGWAPFHYGRWYNDPSYGYVWVPGYDWGPGWVTWRQSNDYYGWAPIGPGININVAYGNGYNLPYNQWNFVRCNDFGRRDLHNYYLDRSRNVTIVNNTTVINNTRVDNTRNVTYTPGPDRADVQRRSGRPVTQVAIVDEKQPTQRLSKNTVQLYRPVIEKSDAGKKPVPSKLTPMAEMKKEPANQPAVRNNDPANTRVRQNDAVKQPASPNSANVATQPGREKSIQEQQIIKKPSRDEQAAAAQQPVKQPVRNGEAIPQTPARTATDNQPDRLSNQQQTESRDRTPAQQNADARNKNRVDAIEQRRQQDQRQQAQPENNREPVRQNPVREQPAAQDQRSPVQAQPENNRELIKQNPVREQPATQDQRSPTRSQREPVRQEPVREPQVQPEQRPQSQPNINREPVRQDPVRERVQPQQRPQSQPNINRQPAPQQPARQPAMQRPPARRPGR